MVINMLKQAYKVFLDLSPRTSQLVREENGKVKWHHFQEESRSRDNYLMHVIGRYCSVKMRID